MREKDKIKKLKEYIIDFIFRLSERIKYYELRGLNSEKIKTEREVFRIILSKLIHIERNQP